MSLARFANPSRFSGLSATILPWVAGVTAMLFIAGLYLGLISAPADYQQGDTVRIMFVHVPAAWMALFVYVFMAAASAVALVFRHPLADVAAKAAAPIGAGFTAIALVSGSLWGQPMWGAFWVWDARLTSMLILQFLYLGYIALWQAFDDPAKAARAAAVLALVGVVNIPVIHFSVDWWNTLHQPASVARMGGPRIHISILMPLLVMAAAFKGYFLTVLLWRMRAELAAARIRALRLKRVTE